MERRTFKVSSFSDQPSSYGSSKSPRRFLFIIFFLLIFLVGIGFILINGGVFGSSSSNSISPTPTPTDIPFPTDTPTPTSEPTTSVAPTGRTSPTVSPTGKAGSTEKNSLTITVQNGSGVSGVAGKAEAFLDNLGYNVVSTSNADSFDYEDVSITIKKEKSSFLSQLQKDLATSYTVSSTSATLPSSFSSDALVIIGK